MKFTRETALAFDSTGDTSSWIAVNYFPRSHLMLHPLVRSYPCGVA
jgi:hypothetical protein